MNIDSHDLMAELRFRALLHDQTITQCVGAALMVVLADSMPIRFFGLALFGVFAWKAVRCSQAIDHLRLLIDRTALREATP